MDGLARLVWRRVSCPAPELVFGIAAPQGRETPAGAGWRKTQPKSLQDGLQGRVAPRSSFQSIRDPKGRANALELAAKKSPAGAVPA